MLIKNIDRPVRVRVAAHHFLLSETDAIALVESQLRVIAEHWRGVCDKAGLGVAERSLFWGRQFLNPYAFHGLTGNAAGIARLVGEVRGDAG